MSEQIQFSMRYTRLAGRLREGSNTMYGVFPTTTAVSKLVMVVRYGNQNAPTKTLRNRPRSPAGQTSDSYAFL